MTKRFLKKDWFIQHHISLVLVAFLAVSLLPNVYLAGAALTISFLIVSLTKTRTIQLSAMPGMGAMIIIAIVCFFNGAFKWANSEVGNWPFLRDLYYFCLPFLYWQVAGVVLRSGKINKHTLYSTIYFFSGLCAVASIAEKAIALTRYTLSFSTITANGHMNEWIIAVGCYMSFFRPEIEQKTYITKRWDRILSSCIVFAALLSYSRTAYVIIICLAAFNSVQHLKTVVKIVICGIAAAALMSAVFPTETEFFVKKIKNSLQEISAEQSSWNDYKVVNNWRGYEAYSSLQKFEQADQMEKVWGHGFGSKISVQGYAYLVTGEGSLPYLHNGYYTMLIKGGIMGIFLYFVIYLCWLRDAASRCRNKYDKRLCLGLIVSMAFSTVTIMGLFYNGVPFYCFVICRALISNYSQGVSITSVCPSA